LGSLPLALRWSLLGSLWQEAAVRLAAFLDPRPLAVKGSGPSPVKEKPCF